MKSCKLIRNEGETYSGKQGFDYFAGISKESALSEALCIHLLTIPAGVPHRPYNPTDKPVRAVIARTDPNEQESVVLLG